MTLPPAPELSDIGRKVLAEALTPGAALLDDVKRFIARFVAFPSDSALTSVTLWAAHTHLIACFENTPRIACLSPEPGSGKTRTLEVLELLCPEPMHVLNASPAAIFRTIQQQRPTLLLDEVDTVFTRKGKDDEHADLRGLLNSGYRAGATIPRCVGPRHEVQMFPRSASTVLIPAMFRLFASPLRAPVHPSNPNTTSPSVRWPSTRRQTGR